MVLKETKLHQPSDDTDMTEASLRTQLCLSVLTMIVCFAVFCATTFAWFTSQKDSAVSPVVAAAYDVSVTVDGHPVGPEGYICPLTQADRHEVVITATGTASTGYCVIESNGQACTTGQIAQGQSMTLTIVAAKGTELHFSSAWGTHDGASLCGEWTVSETPNVLYTIAENVTLAMIAEHYQVPEADILCYNGIETVTVGATIRIPGTSVTEPLYPAEEPDAEEAVSEEPSAEEMTVEDPLTVVQEETAPDLDDYTSYTPDDPLGY